MSFELESNKIAFMQRDSKVPQEVFAFLNE
jgi:hypothetical protein